MRFSQSSRRHFAGPEDDEEGLGPRPATVPPREIRWVRETSKDAFRDAPGV